MRGEYVRVDIIQGDSNQLEIDKEANSIKQKDSASRSKQFD
jgi:hypothetical protein